MAVPMLYGYESWAPRKKHYRQMETSEIKYLRSVKGCIRLDHIKNEDIRQELKVQPVTELAKNYKKRWKEHVLRMSPERIPRKIPVSYTHLDVYKRQLKAY